MLSHYIFSRKKLVIDANRNFPKKGDFFYSFFEKNTFWPPPYSFRKRDDEAESAPSKKSLLSDTDIDQLTPPNNSPLPPASDEQNIRNIINFLEPHRNLSYIIEGCVQKIVRVLKMKGDPPSPQFFKCQSFHSNAVWNKKRDHATDGRFWIFWQIDSCL